LLGDSVGTAAKEDTAGSVETTAAARNTKIRNEAFRSRRITPVLRHLWGIRLEEVRYIIIIAATEDQCVCSQCSLQVNRDMMDTKQVPKFPRRKPKLYPTGTHILIKVPVRRAKGRAGPEAAGQGIESECSQLVVVFLLSALDCNQRIIASEEWNIVMRIKESQRMAIEGRTILREVDRADGWDRSFGSHDSPFSHQLCCLQLFPRRYMGIPKTACTRIRKQPVFPFVSAFRGLELFGGNCF
jgi:hypothetical protein